MFWFRSPVSGDDEVQDGRVCVGSKMLVVDPGYVGGV
jgi:hypothetical protein